MELDILINNFHRGRGTWNRNTNLLKDKDYLQLINTCVKDEIVKYAIPVYNTEKIYEIHENEIQLRISDDIFLETLILRTQGESIEFFSMKKSKENLTEKETNR